jgi:hypothetical protein
VTSSRARSHNATRATRLLAALSMLFVASVAAVASAPPADAVDQSKGTPGFCPNGNGVTVVVDFQQLGGETIVRCFPATTRGDGLAALKGAGFQIAGVQRWGEAFICRLENRPSAVEAIPIHGNTSYKEPCVDTPPATAYWSYWQAGNNCPWQYSQRGVKNHEFSLGGFEGWSFALNATGGTIPQPRIAPVRPGTTGGPCTPPGGTAPPPDDPRVQVQAPAPPPLRPSTDAPPAPPTDGGDAPEPANDGIVRSDPPATSPSARANEKKNAKAPSTAPTTSSVGDPSGNVAFTGGENAADVNDLLNEQSDSNPLAKWVAVGVVGALVLAAVYTARRRRRARES